MSVDSLCNICAGLVLSGRSDPYEIRLGTWTELQSQAQSHCKGCRFFVDLLTKYVHHQGASDVAEYFTSLNADTNRRYGDSNDFDKNEFVDEVWISGMRLLFKPAQMVSVGGSIYTCDELCLEVCSLAPELGIPELPNCDHRRIIPTNSGDEDCYALIKTWMGECRKHGCHPLSAVKLPKRVIEIYGDPEIGCRLVETENQSGSFACMSSHWENVSIVTLNKHNHAQFLDGLPMGDLAPNCQDAIKIARALEMRYIWIDVLCVLQDDEVEMAEELAKACEYCSDCSLMISADDATNAQSGIFHDRLIQYSPPLGPRRDRCLRPACLRWLDAITSSPLSKHAFAVQQRILAPRILHYTKRQMVWECTHGWNLEAAHRIDESMGSRQPRYDKALVQPLLNRPREKGVMAEDDTTARLDAWFKCVGEFSGATLNRPCDKLLAIAGLASALGDGSNDDSLGDYFAGIWTKALPISMTWSRQYHLLKKPAEYRAPSWSWASVDGTISYDPARKMTLEATPWMRDHIPRILETRIVHDGVSSRFTGFLPGCSIVLEACCLPVKSLTSLSKTFRPMVVLDTSNAFDCHCCRANEQAVDTSSAPVEAISSYICMIAYGDGFKNDESSIDAVILHPIPIDDGNTYERVGLLRLAFDWPDNEGRFAEGYQGQTVDEEFDAMGWERKVITLV